MNSFSQSHQASGDVRCSSAISKLPNNPLLLSPIKKKKNVSFSPNARMRRALHINDYTDEEILSTWYTDGEMNNIREEISHTVHLIEADSELLLCNKKYCTRGLEIYITPELMQQRLGNKIAGRDAVLDEQDRQDILGIVDYEQISNVYKVVSSHCQVAASHMGAADEKAVAANCHHMPSRTHSSSKLKQQYQRSRRDGTHWVM